MHADIEQRLTFARQLDPIHLQHCDLNKPDQSTTAPKAPRHGLELAPGFRGYFAGFASQLPELERHIFGPNNLPPKFGPVPGRWHDAHARATAAMPVNDEHQLKTGPHQRPSC